LPAILWGGNYYADKLPPTSGWLVWDKERPDTLDQATCELAWSNCIKGVRRFRHLWNGFIRASERGQAYHPTQKPVALMEWCLSLKWVQSLSVVIDPFMGSGSTGVACVKQQKRFIGVELSLDYLKIAKQRIQQALLENRQQGKHHA
jgi:DNA modification methylase